MQHALFWSSVVSSLSPPIHLTTLLRTSSSMQPAPPMADAASHEVLPQRPPRARRTAAEPPPASLKRPRDADEPAEPRAAVEEEEAQHCACVAWREVDDASQSFECARGRPLLPRLLLMRVSQTWTTRRTSSCTPVRAQSLRSALSFWLALTCSQGARRWRRRSDGVRCACLTTWRASCPACHCGSF
jgi:hypothetical protein